MLVPLYVEVDAFSLVILSWVLFRLRHSVDQRLENILFAQTTRVVITALLVDISLVLLRQGHGLAAYVLVNALEVVYMSLTAIVGYYWMLYVISEYSKLKRTLLRRKSRILMSFPWLVLSALSVVSPVTGWIFTIDRDTLQAGLGSLYLVQYVIAYGYFVFSLVFILFGRIFQREFIKPRFEVSLLYVLMLVIMGILNLWHPGIPAAWPALALIVMMIHGGILEQQVSLDGLTRLNNRRSFDLYFRGKVASDSPLAFYMMDIDKFKYINDGWGHLEGDSAIVAVADILRRLCANKNAFLARYGGDEFVIVYLCATEAEALAFKQEIHDALVREAESGIRQYPLMVSIGVSFAPPDIHRNGDAIIARADNMLYKEKALVHSIHTTPEKLWAEFTRRNPDVKSSYSAWSFGMTDAEADSLAALVLQGEKTATASAFELYEIEGDALPREGEYSIVLNAKQEALCVIQTVNVSIVPFDQVGAAHAAKEGEGDRSLAFWRESHRAFFETELGQHGIAFTETMPVVLEEFQLVYPPPLKPRTLV